jgi:hypothetical protein
MFIQSPHKASRAETRGRRRPLRRLVIRHNLSRVSEALVTTANRSGPLNRTCRPNGNGQRQVKGNARGTLPV